MAGGGISRDTLTPRMEKVIRCSWLAMSFFRTTGEQGSFDAGSREQSSPQKYIERRRGVKEPPARGFPSYWLVATEPGRPGPQRHEVYI
jgi:hypothetical protein